MNDFVDLDENQLKKQDFEPVIYIPSLNSKNGVSISSISKNSIFSQDWKISKPITEMTKTELEDYKKSLYDPFAPTTIPNSKAWVGGKGSEITTCFDMLQIDDTPSTAVKMDIDETISESFLVPSPATLFEQTPILLNFPNPTTVECGPLLLLPPLQSNPSMSSFKSASGNTDVPNLATTPYLFRDTYFSPTNETSRQLMSLIFLPTPRNEIGEGVSSRVYIGSYGGNKCAVKVVKGGGAGAARREVWILNKIRMSAKNSQSVLKVHDVRNWDATISLFDGIVNEPIPELGFAYEKDLILVLEYCENGDLWSWSQKNPTSISRRLWFKWARQILSAVSACHSLGIIHHDLKPHNLLLDELLNVKLSDFGISRIVSSPDFLVHDDGILSKGTLSYQAPELLATNSPSPYSFPVDLYSVGASLYTLISLLPPFSPHSKSSTRMYHFIQQGFFERGAQGYVDRWPDGDPASMKWNFGDGSPVSFDISSFIMSMVSHDASKRPSALEASNALEALVETVL